MNLEGDGPLVVRTGHAAKDQHHGRRSMWSVHGGDQFAALYASPNASFKKPSKKRSISFLEDDLTDTATVPSTLRAPSLFTNRLNGPRVSTPEATAEATWVLRRAAAPSESDDMGTPGAEEAVEDGRGLDLGFSLDRATNQVLTVDGFSEGVICRRGSLRPGDRIVAVNNVLIPSGGCALDLLPPIEQQATFVHFDVAREHDEATPCASLRDSNPAKRISSVGTALSKLGSSLGGLGALGSLRRNSNSATDLTRLQGICESGSPNADAASAPSALNRPLGLSSLGAQTEATRLRGICERGSPDSAASGVSSAKPRGLSALGVHDGASDDAAQAGGDSRQTAERSAAGEAPEGNATPSEKVLFFAAVPCEDALDFEFNDNNELVQSSSLSASAASSRGSSMHGSSMHGSSMHGSSVHGSGGSTHGGSAHGGSTHGGSKHGGSRFGGLGLGRLGKAASPDLGDRGVRVQVELFEGDEVVWVDGSPLPQGASAAEALSKLHDERRSRQGGLSRAQDRAFLIGVRRDVSAAGGEIRLRGRGRGRLRELKYRAWREMDLRRTTLASGGKSAHSRAFELSNDVLNDVLAAEFSHFSIRQAGDAAMMLGSGTAGSPGLSSPEPGLLAETTSDEAESEGPNKWEAVDGR